LINNEKKYNISLCKCSCASIDKIKNKENGLFDNGKQSYVTNIILNQLFKHFKGKILPFLVRFCTQELLNKTWLIYWHTSDMDLSAKNFNVVFE
jgi:hypothetical protein